MQHGKTSKKTGNATRASVNKKMAKPHLVKCARIAEQKLDAARISQQASVTMLGTVEKVSPSSRPRQPEKALIGVDGDDRWQRNLRSENTVAGHS